MSIKGDLAMQGLDISSEHSVWDMSLGQNCIFLMLIRQSELPLLFFSGVKVFCMCLDEALGYGSVASLGRWCLHG